MCLTMYEMVVQRIKIRRKINANNQSLQWWGLYINWWHNKICLKLHGKCAGFI